MVKLNRKFLPTEYGQLHLRVAGVNNSTNLPLLCLHMAPQSGQDFEDFMKLASRERLVIAPDYHGYGESEPITDTSKVTIEAYAKSIWQALDSFNIEQIEILGHHTGSKVGIEMSLQHPSKVNRLMCIALSTMTPGQFASSKTSFKAFSNQEKSDGFADWWKTILDYYDANMPYDELAQKFAISVKSGSRFYLGFQAAHSYNANILEKLGALKMPTIIVNPNDDLQDITPLAANYVENVALIQKPEWQPGFLTLKPEQVLECLQLEAWY